MDRRMFLASAAFASSSAFLGVAGAAPTSEHRLSTPDAELWDPLAGEVIEEQASGPNGPLYVRRYGKRGATPIIVLHGGPAAGHRYMLPYAALAKNREVAFYDQSGCGRSAAPVGE